MKAKPLGQLKSGYTTGSYATATAVAAARFLLLNETPNQVSIQLPKGKQVFLPIQSIKKDTTGALAYAIKDAGDDPDVTHGCLLHTHIKLIHQKKCVFKAGKGVGVVTKTGLPVAVGEPAINSVPRQMLQTNLADLSSRVGYHGGFLITIGIKNGLAIAQKTLGPRLGIVGGLCILGTTGIVKPFSCGAYIASIYQSIDVAMANGCNHLVLVTGSTSLKFALNCQAFEPLSIIETGDFLHAAFKRLRRYKLKKITLISAWSKLIKIAQHNANLHSQFSAIDRKNLMRYMKNEAQQKKLVESNTLLGVMDLFDQQAKTDLCKRCTQFLKQHVASDQFDAIVVDRSAKWLASDHIK